MDVLPTGAQRRSGRRPGDSGTRDAITTAARLQFGTLGYDRTSLRSVAREAGVDPGLVGHFFGTKQQLFTTVMELPFEPGAALPRIIDGDRGQIGLRFAGFVLSLLESPEGAARITGLVRAAATEEEAARMVRDLITRDVLTPLAGALGEDRPKVRGALAGSQVVGLVMARYVVKVEPLASLPADEVAALVAPVLQHYLAEPLG
jgi:AcrR family transcriptional regulator